MVVTIGAYLMSCAHISVCGHHIIVIVI